MRENISPDHNILACCTKVFCLYQIYAYTMHKNLAVDKIMEAMRTAYAKKTGLGLNTSPTKDVASDHET